MGLIIPLIIFVGFVAIIVWIYAALANLDRRLASGEIEQAEYEEKRKSAGKIGRRHKRRQKAEEAGQQLAYIYYEDEPERRVAAKMLTKDEARRIAANVAKLPDLPRTLQ
jgi:hypothetical protein